MSGDYHFDPDGELGGDPFKFIDFDGLATFGLERGIACTAARDASSAGIAADGGVRVNALQSAIDGRVAPQPASKVDILKRDARRKAVPMREATAPSTPAKPEAKAAPLDWVAEAIAGWGVEAVDKRDRMGNLWVLGDYELDAKMDELAKLSAKFTFRPGDGRVTGHRDGWWMSGMLERRGAVEEKPPIAQGQIDALEPGDSVFHKAFAYGGIIDISDSYIEFAFDSGNKKKSSRKLMFLGAFHQGLLQIG